MAKVYDTATDLITFARLQAQNTTSGSSYLGSDGLLKFAAEDEPRIEYGSDGALKGLLIEELRTNLVTHSEDFSNAAWQKVGSVAIDSTLVTGPDGALSGRRVLNFADAGGHRLALYFPITNATLTGSLWVKGEGSNIGKDIQIVVKRSGGTFVGANVSHTLTADWKRIHATFTQDPTNTGANVVLVNPSNGNEASEVLVYGAQLEVGSFATSYIPTSGSQQTRSADVASIPVSAFGYNQDAGTWLMEWDTADTGNVQAKYVLSSGGNARVMYNNAGSTTFYSYDGSTPLPTYTNPTAITFDGSHIKAAYAEDDGGSSVAHTGVLGTGSGASDLLPNYNPTYVWSIGNLNNAAYFLNGHIKSLSYYPRRLTNAQLQELTS